MTDSSPAIAEIPTEQPTPFQVRVVSCWALEGTLNELIRAGYAPRQIVPHNGLAADAGAGDHAQRFTVIAVPMSPLLTTEQLAEMRKIQAEIQESMHNTPRVIPAGGLRVVKSTTEDK